MSIYSENLAVMKVHTPTLFELISSGDEQETNDPVTDLQIAESKYNQNNYLQITVEEKQYRLNSSYHPQDEAKIWAEQFNRNNLGIIAVMFGFGNGIFLNELVKRQNKDNLILIYEPSRKIFEYVLKQYDIRELLESKQVVLHVGENQWKNFVIDLKGRFDWINIRSQIILCHPFYDAMFLEQHCFFLREIKDNNELTLINRNTSAHFGKTIIRNVISNLMEIDRSNRLDDFIEKIPSDVPAIIVSAGPSLAKNINVLKEAKNKALIIATDSAVRFMIENEIFPDCIVTLDPNKPEEYLEDPLCKSIPFFFAIEGNRKILKDHRGPIILYSVMNIHKKIFMTNKNLITGVSTGGSVATGAFSLCLHLKINRIILIGQDLAFGNGVTHVGGFNDGSIQEGGSGTRMVEGIDGGLVQTRHDWYSFLKWFESTIAILNEVDVIDATEGGAKIHGSITMTLKETIAQYCKTEFIFEDFIRTMPLPFTELDCNNIKEQFLLCYKELDEIISKSSTVISLCEKVIKACKNSQMDSKYTKKMIATILSMNEEVEQTVVYSLLDLYITSDVTLCLETINQFGDDEKENFKKTFEKTRIMQEAIRNSSKELIEIFQQELKEKLQI